MALAQQVPNLGLARFSVQDKSILITGATGSLGRVAARALADAGARLTLAGGNSAGLAELVNGAGIDDAAVVTCRPDSLADAQQMVEAALGRYGRLDGVLVASGSNHVAPITEMAVEDFDAVMDANVRGAWLVCRAADGCCSSRVRAAAWCWCRPFAAGWAMPPVTARTARRRRAPICWPRHWRPNGAVTAFG